MLTAFLADIFGILLHVSRPSCKRMSEVEPIMYVDASYLERADEKRGHIVFS